MPLMSIYPIYVSPCEVLAVKQALGTLVAAVAEQAVLLQAGLTHNFGFVNELPLRTAMWPIICTSAC